MSCEQLQAGIVLGAIILGGSCTGEIALGGNFPWPIVPGRIFWRKIVRGGQLSLGKLSQNRNSRNFYGDVGFICCCDLSSDATTDSIRRDPKMEPHFRTLCSFFVTISFTKKRQRKILNSRNHVSFIKRRKTNRT